MCTCKHNRTELNRWTPHFCTLRLHLSGYKLIIDNRCNGFIVRSARRRRRPLWASSLCRSDGGDMKCQRRCIFTVGHLCNGICTLHQIHRINKRVFILYHSRLVIHSKSTAWAFYTNKSIFYDLVDKHLFVVASKEINLSHTCWLIGCKMICFVRSQHRTNLTSDTEAPSDTSAALVQLNKSITNKTILISKISIVTYRSDDQAHFQKMTTPHPSPVSGCGPVHVYWCFKFKCRLSMKY